MTKLPVVSSKQAIRAFETAGWQVARQKGIHITMAKAGSHIVLTIPERREVPRGLLRSLIRLAGLTVDEFVSLIQG
jgi:predicted RNA binding protein YcfA (HicA-like mRNA interferase family)